MVKVFDSDVDSTSNNGPSIGRRLPDQLPPERYDDEHDSIFTQFSSERRPLVIVLVLLAIAALGFILGALFTVGILNGWIEIDPKMIKDSLKAILGKN
ncbi:MAG: hypothetical protein NT027_10925 [Proteobacteria bacterium]|nr:hypothetical protein [Pseudomonadota bacterium]